MSLSVADDRKVCPNCGHSNRAAAKNCTQCGFAFFLQDTSGMLRKRCSRCGHMNRMGAQVCSQCGSVFHSIVVAPRAQRQKWCPQCGARRKDGAKVCRFCGYHFKEPESAPEPAAVRAPEATAIRLPLAAAEPPVVQSDDLAEPVAVQSVTTTTPTPSPPDLSGEPAPFIPTEELERLRRMGGQRPGVFVRLFQVLRDDKR